MRGTGRAHVATECRDELAHRLVRGTGLIQSLEEAFSVLILARPPQHILNVLLDLRGRACTRHREFVARRPEL
ncbi:hypothetical protein [Paraburkholderia phenazinium]|uniref:hypothetical protein n=1 Tax=Paraburkholderia phenazinium TaxID=60549 RepID=UPI001FC9E22B|nr:hypothetical protein [Paraburkholderia phenazinium]